MRRHCDVKRLPALATILFVHNVGIGRQAAGEDALEGGFEGSAVEVIEVYAVDVHCVALRSIGALLRAEWGERMCSTRSSHVAGASVSPVATLAIVSILHASSLRIRRAEGKIRTGLAVAAEKLWWHSHCARKGHEKFGAQLGRPAGWAQSTHRPA